MPSGARARFAANLAALRVLGELDGPATPAQREVLLGWSSWGALPAVFDETNTGWATEREQLRAILDDRAWDQARRTTINAHYTDPDYVAAVWAALTDLGFDGGDVLEPGCGSGTFIGLAPPSARMTGVELDATTAAITAALYPQAVIRAESFADTDLPPDQFAAAVGNVPFADIRLHDPVHNRANLSMHNHFIVKSLALTRPGGIVAVLTSAYTMDARNPGARRAINSLGDLLGAVRLPTGAHRRTAGTDALTDLLILRRREPGTEPVDRDWETTTTLQLDGQRVAINTHFLAHPDRVLGTLGVGTGMYGGDTTRVTPHPNQSTSNLLTAALADVVTQARARGLTFTPAPEPEPAPVLPQADPTDLWDGTIVAGATPGDGFRVAANGQLEPLKVPATQAAELFELLGLRDLTRALLENEHTQPRDTPELDTQRAQLRAAYLAYADRYGPINRVTLRRTGRTRVPEDPMTGLPGIDAETGEPWPAVEVMGRVTPPAVRLLRTRDPFAHTIYALELYDEQTGTATPAALLSTRQLAPRPQVMGVDTAAEAIAVSLDRTGRIDLDLCADLLGTDPGSARAAIGALAYDDPATGQLVAAPEYLSGDVRIKLEQARTAAADNPTYAANVTALEAVLPTPLGVADIEARMGAVWISPEIHQQFLVELLGDRTVRVENPLPGQWHVRGYQKSVAATSQWGTDRMPAHKIAQHLMDQKPVIISDTVEKPEGGFREVVNPVETAAAQEKAEAMAARFTDWVWEDPARANMLLDDYNRRFNSLVLRDYSAAGEHLSLPGLAQSITLRPHQRAAVARMIAEPAVGLFHQVGAGKTLELIAGATELRRLGLIRKPAFVVPNHMLEQFTREWLAAYPAARVLAAATDDICGDKRRQFIARAAGHDWDGIIMTYEAFKAIEVGPEFKAEYITTQTAALRQSLDTAREAGRSASVKEIEKAITRHEQDLKKALDTPRDEGLRFQDTGIDYLCVDEAHNFKNLKTESHIPDAQIGGAKHATDLHMKLEYLRARYGGRCATLATATPLANSITEAHVMQRYLRPDLLAAAGITSFDAWAATFGASVAEMEMGPAGGYRVKTRFARFTNVPEMLRIWAVFADVKTAEDLHLPVPQLAPRPSDGQRAVQTTVVEPSSALRDYMVLIGQRASDVGSGATDARTDNMLLISTDARKAALDMRLVTPGVDPTETTKLDVVAATITDHHHQNTGRVYPDETGAVSAVTGSLQLVFCDLGTPKPGQWSVYGQLKAKLVAGGIPEDQIRFIHEARTDTEKAAMFAAARGGHVRVLIGSTAKMGTGVNVQRRITALHHVDCPWRPADVEQRDGRAIRQGNRNAEVEVHRYVVEGSFDAYSWQTVARKARFIAQVMRGRLDAREIEDIGDTALSAAEAKALASGDPMILEQANANADLQKLRRQQTAHQRGQAAARQKHENLRNDVANTKRAITALTAAAAAATDTSGEHFTATISGRYYTARTDAADALGRAVTDLIDERGRPHGVSPHQPMDPRPVAQLGGHTVTLRTERINDQGDRIAILGLAGVPLSESRHSLPEVRHPGVGLIRALENRVTAITGNVEKMTTRLADHQRELAAAAARLDQPFPHTDALEAARRRVQEIETAMAKAAQRGHSATAPPDQIALPNQPPAPPPMRPALRSPVRGHVGAPGPTGIEM